jgi:hypothetical protein
MRLQFQFYLDTAEGPPMEGETVLCGSTTLDQAIKRARRMLQERTFYFGKATAASSRTKTATSFVRYGVDVTIQPTLGSSIGMQRPVAMSRSPSAATRKASPSPKTRARGKSPVDI